MLELGYKPLPLRVLIVSGAPFSEALQTVAGDEFLAAPVLVLPGGTAWTATITNAGLKASFTATAAQVASALALAGTNRTALLMYGDVVWAKGHFEVL